ncbi:MAG: metallophosphoesterase [Gemmatimonadota bacterium]|nr:metallophosphoesterase [Gemmatimonadota bacterium]
MHCPRITIGLFSDAHYAHLVYGDRHCQDSLAKLRVCMDTFNIRQPDLVINLGDFIDKADDKEAEAAYLAAVRQVCESFAGDLHYVLGNHDLATFNKMEYLAACGTEHPEPYYAFESHGVHCVILDSNCHEDGTDFTAGMFDWDDAWVSEAQLSWLRDYLRRAGDRPVLVFSHGNLDHRLWESRLDPHVVKNAEQVRSILEQAGTVRAVIQAHYHPGLSTTINGIAYIGLRAMVVGAGTVQNAYALLTFWADNTIELEGFDQQPSIRISPEGDIIF